MIVQYLEYTSGCYIAYNTVTKQIVGRKCGGKPFKDIPIIDKVQYDR